jgi:hypothetical protein
MAGRTGEKLWKTLWKAVANSSSSWREEHFGHKLATSFFARRGRGGDSYDGSGEAIRLPFPLNSSVKKNDDRRA